MNYEDIVKEEFIKQHSSPTYRSGRLLLLFMLN